MFRLFDRYVREHKDAAGLPFVVPVVLYHGRSKDVPESLRTLFGPKNDALLQYVPDFSYDMVNLTAAQDSSLRDRGLLQGALLLMKHVRDKDLLEHLPDLMDLLWRIQSADTGIEAIQLYIQYIAAGAINVDEDELLKILENKGGDVMLSLAQKLYDNGRQEGRQEGMEKGLEKGQQWLKDAIIDLLEVRYGEDGEALAPAIQALDLDTLQAVRLAAREGVTIDRVREILGV